MSVDLKVGLVGYCPPTKFDEVKAREMIIDAFDRIQKDFPNANFHLVSGLTNVGVLKIGYEEAAKRHWFLVGIACEKARNFEWYPVDYEIISGDNWGDESPLFVDSIDVIVRIGRGKQSLAETAAVKANGGKAYEYDLPAIE